MSGRNKSVGFAVLSIVLVLAAGLVVSGCGGGAAPKPGKVYKVTFEASGGEPVPEAQLVEAGSKIELPKAMARTKFTFSGWYKDLDCTEPWNFAKDTVESDIILFANWKSAAGKSGGGGSTGGSPGGVVSPGGGTTYFTVIFDANDGTLVGANSKSVANGASVGAGMPSATKTSEVFFGWNTDKYGAGTAFTSKTAVTAGITVYAMWNPLPDRDGSNKPKAFLVSTPDALKEVGKGNYPGWDLVNKYYELNEDIDMGGDSFESIGFSSPFTGTFDGNGHTISNIETDNISTSAIFDTALISVNEGTVKNLGLNGSSLAGTACIGIVGYNSSSGIVEGCHVIGTEFAGAYIGPLVGANEGTVRNCYTLGNTYESSSDTHGGLVGTNYGLIINCYTIDSVTGYYNIGCMAGENDSGSVENCVALGLSITATSDNRLGRIVGNDTSGILTNNYALDTMALTPAMPFVLKPAAPGNPDGVHGADVSLAEAATESWWRYTAGWDSAWGGTSANEAKPWKMGTVNGVPRPVLWYQ